MLAGNWFSKKRFFSRNSEARKPLKKGKRRKQAALGRNLRVEELEDRRMLAVLIVNNLDDLDPNGNVVTGSLRNALQVANATAAQDTIVFADYLFTDPDTRVTVPGSIFLDSRPNGGQLTITNPVDILGPGASTLTISSGGTFRLFETNIDAINQVRPVTIGGMTLSGGSLTGTDDSDANRGGAILNRENLTLVETIITGNLASQGGGAIFNLTGVLTVERSLLINNSSSGGGGAILNGTPNPANPATTNVISSTISGNSTFGAGGTPPRPGYGGAIFNRNGTLNVISSTIVENTGDSGGLGQAIASWGNPVPDIDDDGTVGEIPDPVVFTSVSSSIIYNNGYVDGDQPEVPFEDRHDIDNVGMSDDEEDPVPLLLSITSLGFNIVGGGNVTNGPLPGAPPVNVPVSAFSEDLGDQINVNPLLLGLGDYGGATPTYYLSNPEDVDSDERSPAIDAGGTGFGFDQRGLRFVREFGEAMDVGAVEVQEGFFTVDILLDETDGQTASISASYSTPGDFSLREAIEFAEKNPEFDTIDFSDILLLLPDTTASKPPTIFLKLTTPLDPRSALSISASLDIIGPERYELEVDATGNDPTPSVNNADGTRILLLDDGQSTTNIDVSISGLTFLGGDVTGDGGGFLNRENLSLTKVNVKENFASSHGGGIVTMNGELIITNSALYDNSAGTNGGAILLTPGAEGAVSKATLRNSTVSRNVALRGGGILNDDGEFLIEYSTITQNAAPLGAGIANLNRPNAITQLRSTIVSGNLGDDILVLGGGVPTAHSLGFNLIGSGNTLAAFSQPGDLVGINNPGLSELTVEGGFTRVHRLLPDSPAIDKGNSFAVDGVDLVPNFDQRGFPFVRVFDGLRDTKERIDIGAYELQGATFVVDSAADENDGNISKGNLSLREAIELSNTNPLTDTIMFDALLLRNAVILQQSMNSPDLSAGTPTDMRITDSVNIIGLGEGLLTLDGTAAVTDNAVPFLPDGTAPRSRFFTIDDNNSANVIDVHISGMTFQNSSEVTMHGASLYSSENLKLKDITFIDNSTLGDGYNGGALFQQGGSLEIDDLLFTANRTDGVDADGGAIYVRDVTLTMRDSTISGNATAQTLAGGGGLYIHSGTLNMSNSYITGNVTPGGEADGAGIFGMQSVLNINNSFVTGNLLTGSNSEGAGIFSKDSVLNLTESVVALNSTTGSQSEGAGVFIEGGSATIDRSTVSLNTTAGHSATGAGVAIVNGNLLIRSSKLDRNTSTGAAASGGGVHSLNSHVTILDSTISGSKVLGLNSQGGAIFSQSNLGGAKTLIINSTISGNAASLSGGGIYNAGGTTEIRHSTITNNSVSFFGNGGGVASRGTSNTTTTRVYSSIIAGNFSTDDPARPISDVDSPAGSGGNSFESLGYNVIGKGLSLALDTFVQTGDQRNVTDPGLGVLGFNGGPTSVHLLQEDSPAVNAGDPSATPGAGTAPMFDQRGVDFSRVLGGRIDVGAVESTFTPSLASDFDGDGDIDGSDFLAWQRGFGKPSAQVSDGDANGDQVVNAADLTVWNTNYGTTAGTSSAGTSSALAMMSMSGSHETSPALASVAADSATSSEPLVAATVQSSSSLPAASILSGLSGLTLAPLAGSNESQEFVAESTSPAEINAAEASLAAREDSFATFPQLAVSSSLGDVETSEETNSEELEVTLEDRFFDLLGSDV